MAITIDTLIAFYKKQGDALLKSIIENREGIISVRCFYRHIPHRGKNEDAPEELLKVTDEYYKILYDYCIKEKVFSSKYSFEDFLMGVPFCSNALKDEQRSK